jgi:hypothetical protein
MKTEINKNAQNEKLIIKKCHVCGHIMENPQEIQKCHKCKQSFLPTNYFSKVHSTNQRDYDHLFAYGHELHETDLIKGLTVIW